jgi:3-deoxy-D-manno-octulosonic-acid transferase
MLSLALYRVLTLPAWTLLQIAALVFPRVRENAQARRGWQPRLRAALAACPPARATVWIHSASMGEFEAIRPLARALRADGLRVLITFFSTSGPRHLKGAVEADVVEYLPFDTPRAARRFVELVKPDLVLVTKHDLWPNLLLEARRNGARLWFINANFHARSRLAMPWLRSFHRQLLSHFDWIATVGPDMASRFEHLLKGCQVPVEALGDSRFDRGVERARGSKAAEGLPAGFRDGRVVVVGSSWEPDEALLLPVLQRARATRPDLRLLLVPHEPTETHLSQLEQELARRGMGCMRLAQVEAGQPWRGEVAVLVDRVGLLAGLYEGARLAWVGGGLTTGVHSVIEPAAFGLPVLFGPRHHVSQEAQDLLACGGGAEVGDGAQLEGLLLRLLDDAATHGRMAAAALDLVGRRTGVTARLHARILRELGGREAVGLS